MRRSDAPGCAATPTASWRSSACTSASSTGAGGHGRRLLRALEERAQQLGYRRVVLETGSAQPEATALYAGEGYLPIAGYGHYRDAPGNRCFAKEL